MPRADRSLALHVGTLATALMVVVAASPASAQTEAGGFASVALSAATIAGGTSLAVSTGIGYRINRTVAVGFELTVIPNVTTDTPDLPFSIAESSLIFPSPVVRLGSRDARATIFTGNLRLTVPTRSSRLSPYLVGGVGVGNVHEELSYALDFEPVFPVEFPLPLPATVIFPSIQQSFVSSTTDVAITMGGGISVAMGNQWSIDGDARYLAIAGNRDRQIGRFGAGVSYRF